MEVKVKLDWMPVPVKSVNTLDSDSRRSAPDADYSKAAVLLCVHQEVSLRPHPKIGAERAPDLGEICRRMQTGLH